MIAEAVAVAVADGAAVSSKDSSDSFLNAGTQTATASSLAGTILAGGTKYLDRRGSFRFRSLRALVIGFRGQLLRARILGPWWT